ncbi:G-protein coupled receptor dmsr-1-like [Neocloeon triangulifer]|uniref:G-protein coupled receptor dmsr-1-like n=1 Tax=Neocloeon triangulifer TaxID=2078957 RepID=UPI00286F774C|nr:G-protein coupled receptor dmsr-1-like [Neocloeon triangulifer]
MANSSYCGDFDNLVSAYYSIHGYASLAVCLAGTVSTGLSMVVLSRPELAAPTSSLLSALAAADALVMLEYVPYTLHQYILVDRPAAERFSYGWAVYVLFHAIFTQIFHTISIWLTVTLAVWRYLAVRFPIQSKLWCTAKGTRYAILAACVGSTIICIPLYLSFSVSPFKDGTVYYVRLSELGGVGERLLIHINFWIYSVLIKLLPCVILSFLSQRLLAALWENKQRRRSLLNKDDKDGDRTSRLLMAVLILFLVTELPQGILGLMTVFLGYDFFAQCYNSLGELMDLLALTSSTLNFPLYCLMSRQFRATFAAISRKAFSKVFEKDTSVSSNESVKGQENRGAQL